MGFFGKIFKRGVQVSDVVIPAEIYRDVWVMRDDVNEMQGKPKESFPGAQPDQDPSHAGNPFLGNVPSGVPHDFAGDRNISPAQAAPKDTGRKLLFAGIGAVLLIVFSVSAYLFLRSPVDTGAEPGDTPVLPPTSADIPVPEELPSAPKSDFSLTMPNYLQIDPESDTATPDGISMKLADTARKVKGMNASDPVEFMVRDANNNPMAFSRFAYLAKLGIPEDALALIDESFSLYLVPDGGEIRFALSLDSKDRLGLAALVASNEESLPTWFGRLLYDPAVEIPKRVAFRGGTYGTLGTRFASVDAGKNYSFDYAFVGGKWMIGSSKDSFRAALGKLAVEPQK